MLTFFNLYAFGRSRGRARRCAPSVRSNQFARACGQCAGRESGRRRASAQLRWQRGPAGSDQGWSLRINVQTMCKLLFWYANHVHTYKIGKYVQSVSKPVLCKPCANQKLLRSEQTMCKLSANCTLLYDVNYVQT